MSKSEQEMIEVLRFLLKHATPFKHLMRIYLTKDQFELIKQTVEKAEAA